MSPLLRIKRCCLIGRVIFTVEAEDERVANALTQDDIVESIVNAPAVYKTLRSRGPSRRGQRLYVIVGLTHDAIVVYTKGALRKFEGEDYFYILVSAKRAIEP